MENQNLADFDEIAPLHREDNFGSSGEAAPKAPANKPMNAQKMTLGCLFIFLSVFLILLLAMAFGLSADENTITSLGLNPSSLKNWSIGMVNFLFGAIALISLIVLIFGVSRRFLAGPDDKVGKSRATKRSLLSLGIFIVVVVLWSLVYGYFSQFEIKEPDLPVEIVTNPADTLNLTSPIQIEFSAERITSKFAKTYDIVSYEWDKESDGGVDATGIKNKIYFQDRGKNNGVYEVKLVIKLQPKAGGPIETREYQQEVSIAKQEIYGEITADKESGIVPLTVKLGSNTIKDPDGAKITNFSWDLNGDGRPDREGSTYGTAEWTFDKIGEHVVSLTVTSEDLNDSGTHETKTFKKTITVREPVDQVDASIWIEATPQSGYAPLAVSLFANYEKNTLQNSKIEKYEWQIGDGLATLWGQRAKYTFEKAGNYPVSLVVTFANGQTSTVTNEITVNDKSFSPKAVITTTPAATGTSKTVSGPAPLTVEFDGTKSTDPDDNIVKYEWDFDGDGLWDEEGSTVEHEFLNSKKYETTLRVTDADNNESRATVLVDVAEEKAIVNFGADRLSGPAPLTINFDASGSRVPTGKKIISYEWNFDSENSKSETFIYDRAQTSHIFGIVGEYPVTLTLHTDDGKKYSDTLKVVASNASLAADFTLSRVNGPAPLAISFDASASSGNFNKIAWDFGDGTTGTDVKPTHVFEKAGKYEVILRIYDPFGNVSQTSKIVTAN